MSWCDKVLKDSARYWEKYVYPGIGWGGETGLFIGGEDGSMTYYNTIDSVTISNNSSAVDFGDASQSHQSQIASTSNGNKCIFGPNCSDSTLCHQITFSNKSNSTLYGNLTVARYSLGAFGNGSRSIFGAGTGNETVIDYFDLSTSTNAASFGNMTITSRSGSGSCDDNRGLFILCKSTSGIDGNVIHYVTISQSSDSMDFGDLRTNKANVSSCCCSGKVIISCSHNSETDYVNISTVSNSSEFGTLTTLRTYASSCSNDTKGLFGGGYGPPSLTKIEYVVGSVLSNTINFGELTLARCWFTSSSGD